jgi:PKD repeat protein
MSRSLAIVLLTLTVTSVLASTPCDQWQLVNPLPTDADLLGSAFGNGRFVLVGRSGTVLTSPDELAWQLLPALTDADLQAVTWSAQGFIAVGTSGTVLTSPEGEAWTLQPPVTTETLLDLTAGGPVILAVGTGGTVLSSDDGVTWSQQDAGTSTDLRRVVWTGSEYMALGSGESPVLVSLNGTVWATRDVGLDGPLAALASNQVTTVVVAESGYTVASTDGVSWTRAFASIRPAVVDWAGTEYVGFRTYDNDDSSMASHSLDGLDWQWSQITAPGLSLVTATSNGTVAVAAGRGGAITFSRDDGRHWKPANTFIGLDLYGLAGDETAAVMAAGSPQQSSGAILYSQDLVNWDVVYDMGAESIYGVARGDDYFVAVGVINELWTGGAMILRSTDGRQWQGAVGSLTGDGMYPWQWNAVSWDGSRFIAAGSSSTLAFSSDASSWHLVSPVDGESFTGVASDGSVVVAVGEEGSIAVSDGSSLRVVETELAESLSAVVWGNGTFVAVGDGGLILTSVDGESWVMRESASGADLRGVQYSKHGFSAVGSEGVVLTSVDGTTWSPLGTAGYGELLGVLWSSHEHVVVGRGGYVARIACSAAGSPPEPSFAWRPTYPEAGVPVHFIDLSTGEPSSWQWDFGDGTVADGAAVTHTFATHGTWPVTITVANDQGSAVASSEVTVRRFCGAPPPAEVSAPETVASGETYEISWSATLEPHEFGEYFIAEATDPDFVTATYRNLWSPTTSDSYSHSWSDGGVFYYRVKALNYCLDGSYRQPVSATVQVDIEPDLTDLGENLVVIPAAAHGAGLNSTSWLSDVVIHNPHGYRVPVYLFLLPRVGQGEPEGGSRMWVEPGQSLRIDDAVGTIRSPGSGALLVACDRSLLVGSRTFNDQPDGTFGQYIGGVPVIDAAGPGDELRLIRLTSDQGFRTNLGLANPGPEAAEVRVELHRADGTLLGTSTYDLPGLSSILDVEVLQAVDDEPVSSAYAVVSSVTPDATYVAFASVVDGATGDPVAQPALIGGTRHRVVSRSGQIDGPTQIGRVSLLDTGEVYVLLADRALMWSSDGIDWHIGREFAGYWDVASGLGYGDGKVLAVGSEWVYSSPDGMSWSRTAVPGYELSSIAWDGGKWVAIGPDSTRDGMVVGVSADGASWEITEHEELSLRQVQWAGDRFLATAHRGFATSTDGLSWKITEIEGLEYWIKSVAWNGTQLVVLTQNQLLLSEDLETFRTVELQGGPEDVIWTGEHWVVTSAMAWGEANAFFISHDGEQWQTVTNPGAVKAPMAAVWDGSTVLTVDFDGVLSWLVSDQQDIVVPAAAHVDGFGTSRWRSDLELHNPDATEILCAVDLLKRGAANLAPESVELELRPQSSLGVSDVLDTLFEYHGAAALRIRSEPSSVLVSSRTYNDAPEGSYGQMVPGLRGYDAIWPFETGRLIQLAHTPGRSAGYRTNIGLVSDCVEQMEIVVDLYQGTGEMLGSRRAVLAAHDVRQLNDVFAPVTSSVVTDGFAILSSPTPRCSFYAYASVVDNQSNDPILVPARPWSPDRHH